MLNPTHPNPHANICQFCRHKDPQLQAAGPFLCQYHWHMLACVFGCIDQDPDPDPYPGPDPYPDPNLEFQVGANLEFQVGQLEFQVGSRSTTDLKFRNARYVFGTFLAIPFIKMLPYLT